MAIKMNLDDKDLKNIIKLCRKANDNVAGNLARSCRVALSRHESIYLSKEDKDFLRQQYEPDMDLEICYTINKILS